MQVEQVKKGCFGGIYEDNVWKMKPKLNDQNQKKCCRIFVLEVKDGVEEGQMVSDRCGIWLADEAGLIPTKCVILFTQR